MKQNISFERWLVLKNSTGLPKIERQYLASRHHCQSWAMRRNFVWCWQIFHFSDVGSGAEHDPSCKSPLRSNAASRLLLAPETSSRYGAAYWHAEKAVSSIHLHNSLLRAKIPDKLCSPQRFLRLYKVAAAHISVLTRRRHVAFVYIEVAWLIKKCSGEQYCFTLEEYFEERSEGGGLKQHAHDVGNFYPESLHSSWWKARCNLIHFLVLV